jgi:hypothetical protein
MARKTMAPEALADRLVESWLAALRSSLPACIEGDELNRMIDAVQDAIEHRDAGAFADGDDEGAHEFSGREAAYLVGVQVGLRLRKGGA